jgi:hypothetical protein
MNKDNPASQKLLFEERKNFFLSFHDDPSEFRENFERRKYKEIRSITESIVPL